MIHKHHHHEHNHEHTHEHSHDHTHEHPHGGGGHSEADKVLALMGYMLEHNRQHMAELEAMAKKLTEPSQKESADLLLKSVELYAKGNDKLAESLKKMKKG